MPRSLRSHQHCASLKAKSLPALHNATTVSRTMNKEWTDTVNASQETVTFRVNLERVLSTIEGGFDLRRWFKKMVVDAWESECDLYPEASIPLPDWSSAIGIAAARVARAIPFEITRPSAAGSDSLGTHIFFDVPNPDNDKVHHVVMQCIVVTSIHPLDGYAMREYVWSATVDGKVV